MPLWILFFTALTLALHSVPAEAPEPEPSAPVEVVLTEPVFRAETGLPLYPDYTLDKDLLVWAEEYEASTGTPVVMYDFNTVLEGADQLDNIPESTIRRRYEAGIHNLFELYIPICDYWMIADNSMSPMEVIAKGFRSDKKEIYNSDIYTKLEHHE